jgi:hypothetical protein
LPPPCPTTPQPQAPPNVHLEHVAPPSQQTQQVPPGPVRPLAYSTFFAPPGPTVVPSAHYGAPFSHSSYPPYPALDFPPPMYLRYPPPYPYAMHPRSSSALILR